MSIASQLAMELERDALRDENNALRARMAKLEAALEAVWEAIMDEDVPEAIAIIRHTLAPSIMPIVDEAGQIVGSVMSSGPVEDESGK